MSEGQRLVVADELGILVFESIVLGLKSSDLLCQTVNVT